MNTNFPPRSQPTLVPPSGAAKVADSTRPAGTLAESGQSATLKFEIPASCTEPRDVRGAAVEAQLMTGTMGNKRVSWPPPSPSTAAKLQSEQSAISLNWISKRDALRVTLCGEMQGHYGFLIDGDQSEPFRRDIFIAGVLKDVAKYRQAVKALEEGR